jgi:hypothetical protein
MRRTLLVVSLVTAALVLFSASQGVSRGEQHVESVIGAIVEIDTNARSATIKTDGGALIAIKADETTVCLRIPAGEKTLAKAVAIQFADIAAGDRVLVHGTKTGNEFLAQRLVVMPKAEVEKKREHDLEEWRRRGIGGIVRELNAQSAEITLELRGAGAGGRAVIATEKADFRRYAPESLSFEAARQSNFAEVKVGDQLRALGDKSIDDRTFKAEEIVSGAFKTIGVTVTQIDLLKNEITATTLDQKKPLVISIAKDSVLHRILPVTATAIAQRALANRPVNAAPASLTTTSMPKPTGQPVIDVQQMIDTLPGISLADLKTGDVLAVTGAVEKDESRLVAIKLAAGVDLVLKALAPQSGKPQIVRLSAGLPAVFDFSVIPIN